MFKVICGATGDVAYADTFDGALLAAHTLVDDALGELDTQGRARIVRESLLVAEVTDENDPGGTYQGILTALAREGLRAPLAGAWTS